MGNLERKKETKAPLEKEKKRKMEKAILRFWRRIDGGLVSGKMKK